jgi:hypothetical protein
MNPKNTALLVLLLVSVVASSASAEITYSIEPVIGYERVEKLLPTPRMKQRLVYGARLTAGLFMVAGEAEFLRGTDTESIPSAGLTLTDTEDKLRVGVRARFRLVRLLSFIVRGGVQASRNIHEETVGGATTRTEEPIRYRPYAGAGLQVGLSNNISFTADITTVFRDFPNLNNNDYQTTASLTIRFP